MRRYARLVLLILAAVAVFAMIDRCHAAAEESTAAAPPAPAASPADDFELVEVDWIEEMRQGGGTMIALLVLSIAGVTMLLERLLVLRRKRFAPAGLLDDVLPRIRKEDYAGAVRLCEERPSVLGRTIRFVLEHRRNPMTQVAGRSIVDQEQRTYPLAAVAALAPLLGLLGTMIGMIESFKLVEVFGDEGGASMLAGSISKALITTAVGLVIAIPTLAAYHIFRQRIHKFAMELEQDVQILVNELYLDCDSIDVSKAPTAREVA